MKNRDAIRVYLPKKWDPERWDKGKGGSEHAEKKATGV